jgi:hypothetical protein
MQLVAAILRPAELSAAFIVSREHRFRHPGADETRGGFFLNTEDRAIEREWGTA